MTRKNVIETILETKLTKDEYLHIKYIYKVFYKQPYRIVNGPIEYNYNNKHYRYTLDDIKEYLNEYRQNPVEPQTNQEADELIERLTVCK